MTSIFKDACSVSDRLIIGHRFCSMLSMNERKFDVPLDTKAKQKQLQNITANLNSLARPGDQTQDLSHTSIVCYLLTTHTTER